MQFGLKKILEAVYEPKFRENMYGFRPHRNGHMAIKDMCISIIRKRSYAWEQFDMMQNYYPIAYPKRYVNLYE